MKQSNGQCKTRNAIWQVAQPTAKSDANENINVMAMERVMQWRCRIECSDRRSHASGDVKIDGWWCKGKSSREEKWKSSQTRKRQMCNSKWEYQNGLGVANEGWGARKIPDLNEMASRRMVWCRLGLGVKHVQQSMGNKWDTVKVASESKWKASERLVNIKVK